MKRLSVLFLILAVGACSRTPTPESGELRVIPLAGEVNLLDGDDSSLLEDASTFDVGVNVATGVDGRAEVQLPGGRTLELAPGSNLRVDSDTYEITDGNVLVRTSSPMILRSGGSEFETSPGTFRVERDYSVTFASYEGQATVIGSGVPPVTTLTQANVLQGGEVSGGIVPLVVNPNDPWDIDILGAAIDLGSDLADLERGLTRQLPAKGDIEAVSRVLLKTFSAREIQTAISLLGSAARAVVASVVAEQAARTDGVTESLQALLNEVIDLQIDGAHWIVVVAHLGVARAALAVTRELRNIASQAAEIVAPPARTSSQTQGQIGPRQPGSSGGTSPGGGGPGNTSGNHTNDGGDPAPTEPANDNEQVESAPPPCGTAVECAVEDVLNDTPDGPPGSPGVLP